MSKRTIDSFFRPAASVPVPESTVSLSDDDAESEVGVAKKARTHHFREDWLKEFNWLRGTTLHQSQLDLQRKSGLKLNETYNNDTACAQFVGVIADTLKVKTYTKIKDAPYLSIMIDGDTDVSTKECEIIYARILNEGIPMNILIGHIEVKHAHAQGMSYKDIVGSLALVHGKVISERTLKRILKSNGLCRRKYADLNEIIGFIIDQLNGPGRLHGYRWMHTKCLEHGIRARKEDEELDEIATVWNAHRIRPSTNCNVPCGIPNIMFMAPQLWGTEDFIVQQDSDHLQIAQEACMFLSAIPCDEEVFDLCTILMEERNLRFSSDRRDAFELYVELRDAICSQITE
ncbi:hypothetical protein E1301_Tti022423 [Triplophysa tibetana]|uniref:Uncharacterized protein n=1 Tax=Triplophysa tibetana TaxID=1572043 RepID=A0A5A9PC38_9TELE|nr:hypothetical protein E1301_Tti022423 [Triplophysa tibetana]